MVVERVNVEDIFKLVSLVLSLIISWTFRILAHEEDQHSYVYKILKRQNQAKIIKKSGILFWP